MIPLFRHFPALQGAVPYVSLADLPTPVRRWERLEADAGIVGLYCKCDDVTGLAYGGNKVRKLEFLLGEARARGAQFVITFGAAGSNHALATAIYARKLGMEPVLMLVPQPYSPSIRPNLLRAFAAGASLHLLDSRTAVSRETIAQVLQSRKRSGKRPYIIPAGGSSPVGAVGYVNAALELREQIDARKLPEPDLLYVASGTMGTCVGLLVGLRAAGLKSRLVAVRVTTAPFTSQTKAHQLFERIVGLLRHRDPSFPPLAFPEEQFELRDDFLGEGYARPTDAAQAAVRRICALEETALETTYTGKAAACLLFDAAAGRLTGQNAVFLNTYNSQSSGSVGSDMDYHQLPESFHRYLEAAACATGTGGN